MLTRLRINGFKNLTDVDLHFGPFTCIAGANAVGMSNLFDVILLLKALMEEPIVDAAMAVREARGSLSDIKYLFTQTEKGICLPIRIEAEMLVPGEGCDYLDQPAKALSDGTLRFLALASVEIDPTLTGLICMEEPENGIHPERIGAMHGLLRDIAVDPELPSGEDNPLRQVVINTHSPVVVSQVPDSTLVFAVPEQRVVNGSVMKGVSFRSLSETWRAETAHMSVIAKGRALAFLQPIAEKGDPKRKGADRRVIDREDIGQLQLEL